MVHKITNKNKLENTLIIPSKMKILLEYIMRTQPKKNCEGEK